MVKVFAMVLRFMTNLLSTCSVRRPVQSGSPAMNKESRDWKLQRLVAEA
jgi:hypothetical protein